MVPSGSRKACGACVVNVVALCSIMISSLLVPARVPGFVSLLFSFLRKRILFHRDFSGFFWFRARLLVFCFFLKNGHLMNFFVAHERRGNVVCCCLGG